MEDLLKQSYTPEEIRGMILGLEERVELDNKKMVPAINLDNAATTPAFKKVAEAIYSELLYYGSIGRGQGQKSEHSSIIYTDGRKAIKEFVGLNGDDANYTVIYVNSTTDGMNKLASALITSHEDMILTTRMEHHANDLPWRMRAKTVYADVDKENGCRLKIEDIENILKENNGKVKYVSVTAASNVTGYVNDVHKIAALAHKYGAQIIVDGAQIVAHREFNMLGSKPEENIDFFVFSAHKMYSPYGGGALVGLTEKLNEQTEETRMYVSAHHKIIPHFYGGGMVNAVYDSSVFFTEPPDLFEAGSPNYPGVVGMLESIKILKDIGFNYIMNHEQELLEYAIKKLEVIPGVQLYGDNKKVKDRVGMVIFNIDGIDCFNVAKKLAGLSAIAVRHAAFCAHPYVRRLTDEEPYDIEPTSVNPKHPEGMIRASFGIYTNKDDIDTLAETVKYISENKEALFVEIDSIMADYSNRPNDRG